MRTSRAASTLSKSGSNTDVESGAIDELPVLGGGDSTFCDRLVWDLFENGAVLEYALSFDIVFTSLIVRLGFRAEPSTGFFPATAMAVVENE